MTQSGYVLLTIFILIPIILSTINKPNFFKKHSIAFISAIIVYIILIAVAYYSSYQIEMTLNACDLNNDGSFSTEEMTPECQKAMNNFTNDVGRNFASFTGFIFAFFYFLAIKTITYISTKIKKWTST